MHHVRAERGEDPAQPAHGAGGHAHGGVAGEGHGGQGVHGEALDLAGAWPSPARCVQPADHEAAGAITIASSPRSRR